MMRLSVLVRAECYDVSLVINVVFTLLQCFSYCHRDAQVGLCFVVLRPRLSAVNYPEEVSMLLGVSPLTIARALQRSNSGEQSAGVGKVSEGTR